jgi:hypothetical protein
MKSREKKGCYELVEISKPFDFMPCLLDDRNHYAFQLGVYKKVFRSVCFTALSITERSMPLKPIAIG